MRFLLLALLGTNGCILLAEGEPCAEQERTEHLATISSPMTLREEVLRTRESLIGSLAADSFLSGFNGDRDHCSTFAENAEACVDLAVQNAGGLRDETQCGKRSELQEGKVYQVDIEELLPFANPMIAIYVSGSDLLDAMEHSVRLLGEPGRFAKNGAFLHQAGAALMVDCAGPRRSLDAQRQVQEPGGRVLGLCLRHWSAGGDTEPAWTLVQDSEEAQYTVATNDYLAGGRDGFTMWTDVDSEGKLIPRLAPISSPGTDQGMVSEYLKQLSENGSRVINPAGATQRPDHQCPDVRLPLATLGSRADALANDPSCRFDGGDVVCSFSNLRMTLLRSSSCFDFDE